jgi:hypothetical protein
MTLAVLLGVLTTLPGIEVLRWDEAKGELRWQVFFTLTVGNDGTPTPEAWESLRFLTETVVDAATGDRDVELGMNATGEGLYWILDGDADSITPTELAEWLTQLLALGL